MTDTSNGWRDRAKGEIANAAYAVTEAKSALMACQQIDGAAMPFRVQVYRSLKILDEAWRILMTAKIQIASTTDGEPTPYLQGLLDEKDIEI